MPITPAKGALCAAVSVATLAAAANAEDLLIVDLTITNQVTITATSGLSSATVAGSDTTGVYLENFYGVAGGALTNALMSGDLTNAENPSDLSPRLLRGIAGADPGHLELLVGFHSHFHRRLAGIRWLGHMVAQCIGVFRHAGRQHQWRPLLSR